MPFFPLAGVEIVAILLFLAVGRWVVMSWWRGEIADETLARWLPRRTSRAPRRDAPVEGEPAADGRPALRLIRGGRDGEPHPGVTPRHAHAPREP